VAGTCECPQTQGGLSFGVSQNLDHYDIKDLLNKHPNPERVGSQKKQKGTVLCLDAVGCRVNALAKRERGLPVFCPLDEPEPYDKLDGTEEWDFVYIDMECRVRPGLFPYTGSRWYAAELADYLLAKKIINESCCKAGLRATRHIPSSDLTKHIDTLAAIAGDQKFHKQGILSAIGLWNATKQCVYRKIKSEYQIDAGPGVRSRRPLPDGGFEWTACEEIVDLYSMAPWGRIALDIEQLRIAQAMDILVSGMDCRVLGAHVDGVFFENFEDVEKKTLDIKRFPDGTPHVSAEA
jgi:hypothetical protein